MADFMVKFINPRPLALVDETVPCAVTWELFTDGASTLEGAGARLILTNPEGEEHTYALCFAFTISNNKAEYEVLLSRLRIAWKMGNKALKVSVDSQLVANHLNGIFEARDPAMQKYLKLAEEMANKFDFISIMQVPRSMNKKADALSKLTSLTFSYFVKYVWIEVVEQKSTDVVHMIVPIEEVNTWINPIIAYLRDGTLPVDSAVARKIRIKAPMYTMHDNVLYKKSLLGPLLRCFGPQEVMVIREVHKGTCGMHSGFRTVVGKIMRLGKYWPSIYRDTSDVIKSCVSCQCHAPQVHVSSHDLIPILSAWPFQKWAIDLWVEAKPLKSITGRQIVNFVWEDIVCHFGVPYEIVSDNWKQFTHDPFRAWCDRLNIKQSFSSATHPQENGKVKVTNRDIVAGIGWVRIVRIGLELQMVLWAFRTTPKGSNRETPFSLVYGSEAVIHA
ncbi:uncharacterized protein [Rutidosis leptorrhynchoides]|uniref:uncharacterized protein n=1 Tax=Rutidosis leptorrhynchoides TaxID=125765 RepID=UPI003A9A0268